MKSQTIRGRKHWVYETAGEFRQDHPKGEITPNWREGAEGDWVITDDGSIVQLLKVSRHMPHKRDTKNYSFAKGWCRTVVGTFAIRDQTFMDSDFSLHPNRYTFGGNKPKTTKDRDYNTARDRMFITKVIQGGDPEDVVKEVFRSLSDKRVKNKTALLLRQERIMTEIRKGVLELADESGMTDQFILERLMAIESQASDAPETLNVALGAIKEMMKIRQLGATVKETKQIGLIANIDRTLLDSLERPVLADPKEVKIEEKE